LEEHFGVGEGRELQDGPSAMQFGKEETKAAVSVEMERRRKEVEVTGEVAWCSYQRASMTADGLGDLFK
jgi:hypothetical protein